MSRLRRWFVRGVKQAEPLDINQQKLNFSAQIWEIILANYQDWIGKSEEVADVLAAAPAQRMAATLNLPEALVYRDAAAPAVALVVPRAGGADGSHRQ